MIYQFMSRKLSIDDTLSHSSMFALACFSKICLTTTFQKCFKSKLNSLIEWGKLYCSGPAAWLWKHKWQCIDKNGTEVDVKWDHNKDLRKRTKQIWSPAANKSSISGSDPDIHAQTIPTQPCLCWNKLVSTVVYLFKVYQFMPQFYKSRTKNFFPMGLMISSTPLSATLFPSNLNTSFP